MIKHTFLIALILIAVSCEKHEFAYDAVNLDGKAEFQLGYYVPVTSSTANNITKVEVNGQLYANFKAPLSTYNTIPGGTAGRFFTADPGTINIKMYQGTDMATLVYDKDVAVVAGKQNLFVHSFAQPPVVFDNGYPYVANLTEKTDSTAWVKFYNFLYETAALGPTTLRLQYQYLDFHTNQPVNIGPPVGFGETTGWQPVEVIKDTYISAGSRTITFKIKIVDANGNITGDLQIMGTGGTYSAYTATSSLAIGRRYHHTMAGYRANSLPNSAVRVFAAL